MSKIPLVTQKQKALVVDIDGTIADITHRAKYVNSPEGTKDWHIFNSLMEYDIPKLNVISLVTRLQSTGLPVILVTGRFSQYKKKTIEWLIYHKIDWALLLMRTDGDFRSDCIIKKEIYENNIKDLFDIVAVFDDRDSVVQMWRDQGLLCLQVQKGEY